ncbi:MAG TPA: DRTGG domain-containing protein [Bacillota bacterium]|nr:DRTGG domain-containing protein [Bacillota bacterium]
MTLPTKHEQIIRHIRSLHVGAKISVRSIARNLKVSEGTAYKAIKEAENQGLVHTIERVGTIRIEERKRDQAEQLTFAQVVNIVEGQVLGGNNGLHKTLHKFLIGAMELEAIKQYTEPGSLMIVGNRPEVQELALLEGVAVLITGGFQTTDEIKQLANEKELPIISTSFDTYTVAEMINRAIYDQLIIKDIILVKDVFTPIQDNHFLYVDDKVETYEKLVAHRKVSQFPVVNRQMRLRGMVEASDVEGKSPTVKLEKVMREKPFLVYPDTSVAYVAHMMVWEDLSVVPVVNQGKELQGLFSRKDALKALQQVHRRPNVGNTFEQITASHLKVIDKKDLTFQTKVTPQMMNQLGMLSTSVFTSFITHSSRKLLLQLNKGDIVIENLTIFFIKPIQINDEIMIKPRLLEAGKVYAKIDCELLCKGDVVGKGLLMAQLIDRE